MKTDWLTANADWLTAAVAILVLAFVVGVRAVSRGNVEIRLNDAVIAVLAAFLVLFMSGRIDKFVVSSQGVTVESAKRAILAASAQPIRQQVSPLPVAPIEESLKGGADMIPSVVARGVGSLDFLLGANAYVPQVVQKYLETLSAYPFFRFVTLLTPDGRVAGFIDARRLLAALQARAQGQSFESFAAAVNRGDTAQLAKLPGFLPAAAAVTPQSDKREVLARMEKLGTDWLPVLGPDGKLAGVVDRSRLTASLILDVANQLQAGDAGSTGAPAR